MNQERNKRKLTGILSADVAGFSRLMEENEAVTIKRLEESREIIGKLVNDFDGRVVDSPGDNILAEFNSVVNAVDCAVTIQARLRFFNAQLPENNRMDFRIGVNLGDVIEENGSIYGDGVNIAARIQALAEPGEICISRTAYDQVRSKLNIGYEYLGEHNLKNISEPVRVYRVLTDTKIAGKVIGEKRFLGRITKKAALTVIIILFIVAAGSTGWIIYSKRSLKTEPVSLDKMAFPLPEKYTIAVLPFNNLSGNQTQDYFSEGLTEEVIAGLSKHPDLMIIASNSLFYNRKKPVNIQQANSDLGADYILEGSVRQEGNRARITAQLADAKKGNYIWSETYDREINDILSLQSEIMWQIFRGIRIRLIDGERTPDFLPEKKDDIEYTETFYLLYRYFKERTPESLKSAKLLADKLIQIAPDPWVYFMRGSILIALSMPGNSESSQYLDEVEKDAKTVESLDKGASLAILGQLYLVARRDREKALEYYKKWVDISPGSKNAHFGLGFILLRLQRYDESVKQYELGLRIDPMPEAQNFVYLGIAYSNPSSSGFKNFVKAKSRLIMALAPPNQNNLLAHIYLTLIYTYENQMDNAQRHVKEILRINSFFSVESYRAWPLSDEGVIMFHKELFRKAGLPEKSSFNLFQ